MERFWTANFRDNHRKMAATAKPPDIASASVPDTLAALHVNPETGLTGAEVDARRKEHGYNEVAERKGHPVLKFLGKFWGVSAWMLELIMVLSAVLRKYSDLAVVGALLVVNAVLSFMQERRAAGVVETLRRRLQVSARVLREANWQVVPARELVPGDIVRVRPGDIIPADVKLLTGALSVDQSALTGESKDVDKAPGEVLSSGSVVRRGEGNGVVMLTGAQTYFGRTTELVQQARPKLHIEAVVAKVVRWLFVIVGALLGVVVVLSLIRGAPLLEMVPLMLVLLMSAVPVALPVMFTVSMAVGSKELAKRGVLVTRLSAAEDAATMDVLCVDKTGTITMNQLAVTGVIPLEQRDGNRRAVRRRARVAGSQPGSDRPGVPCRGEGAAHLRRRASGHAGLLRAVRCEKPAHGSRGRAERAAAARDERRRANRRRGLRAPAPGDRGAGGAGQRIGAEGLSDAGGGARPRDGRPALGRIGDAVRSAPAGRQAAHRRASRPRRSGEDAHRRRAGGRERNRARSRAAQHPARGGPEGRGRPGRQRGGRPAGGRRWFRRGVSGGQVHRGAAPAGRGARDRHDGRRRQRCARAAPGRSRHRRQHRDRRRQGRRQRRPDRTRADEHRGAGRAGADHLPAHPDVDHQQDQPDDPEGGLRGHRVRGDRQVRRLRLRDAAAGLHDGLREDRPGHRPRSTVQEAGDVEHRRLHRGVGGAGRRDGRRGAPPPVDRLVALRSGDQRQCPLHLQLPDAALLRRVLHRVRARAPLVLGDDAEQDPRWRPSWRTRSSVPS